MVDFEYTVIRSSRRRTATIKVFPDNRVTVAVPSFISEAQIEAIVAKQSKWIRMRLERNLDARKLCRTKQYETGEYFPYLGKDHRLEVREGLSGRVEIRDGNLVVWIPPRLEKGARKVAIAAQLVQWYRLRAKERLEEYVGTYGRRVGAVPGRVTVKDIKSRWGSCSGRGNISFNWRIVMAPPEVVEYLVVHEMCHLVHMNHSPDFWALVASFIPDFKARKEWLRHNGVSLDF